MSFTGGITCLNGECDSLSTYYLDPSKGPVSVAGGPFPNLEFNAGEICTTIDARNRKLKSVNCNTEQLVMCEINCRVGE